MRLAKKHHESDEFHELWMNSMNHDELDELGEEARVLIKDIHNGPWRYEGLLDDINVVGYDPTGLGRVRFSRPPKGKAHPVNRAHLQALKQVVKGRAKAAEVAKPIGAMSVMDWKRRGKALVLINKLRSLASRIERTLD